MSATVSDTLKTDIRTRLSVIRNNFLKKSVGTDYILEKCVKPVSNVLEFGDSTLNKIMTYTDFKGDNTLLQNTTLDTNTFNRIKKLNTTTGMYGNAAVGDLSNATDSLQTNAFNLSSFYPASTLNVLNAIAQNYNLLRDNWGTFSAGLPVSLKGYAIDTSTNKNSMLPNITTTTYANNANANLNSGFGLSTVVNDDSVNLFAAQRMLLLMILITEIYTAMKIYEDNDNASNTTLARAVLNLMLNKVNIFLQINESSSSSNTGIESSYTQAYQTYKGNQGTINDVKDRLETIRLDLSNNKAYLDSQTSVSRKMDILSYFAYAIGAVLLISIMVVMFVPMDKTKKRSALLILFLLVVLLGAVLYLIGRSIQSESFIGSVTGLAQLPAYGATTATTDITEKLIYPLVLQQILVYLDDTIRLSNTVSSTQVYNNVNASLSREANYYKDTTSQLELGATKAGSMSKVFYLDTTVARSRISLVIALLVIAALTAILTLVFDTSPNAKKTIYIVAVIFIFIAVMLYVLYTAPRVRTDAYKYYWGRPEKINGL